VEKIISLFNNQICWYNKQWKNTEENDSFFAVIVVIVILMLLLLLLAVISIEINVIDAKSITPIKMICNSKIPENKSKLCVSTLP
jgi:uncharacterized integral membrane protein